MMASSVLTVLVVMVMAVGGESGKGLSTTPMAGPPGNLTIFQRVSVEGVVQLLSVARRAEPHSCWCHDPHTTPTPHIGPVTLPLFTVPASPCPVPVPSRHLFKVLKMTCKEGHQHCCLSRGSQLRRSDLGLLWGKMRIAGDNDTVSLGHLESLVNKLATTLTPQGQGVTPVHLGQALTTKVNPLLNMDLPALIMPPAKQRIKTVTKKTSQESHLLAMLQAAAEYLLGQKKLGQKQSSKSPVTSPDNSEAQDSSAVSSGTNTDFLSNVKELLESESVSQFMGKVNDRVKRSTELNDNTIDTTVLKNINTMQDTTDALFEKGEAALPYNQLGWFSRAIEAAMDGSLFVGIIVVTLLATGSLLSAVLPMVTDSCLICALIGYANTVAESEGSF